MDFWRILLICLPWLPAVVRLHPMQAGTAGKYQAKIDEVFAVNDHVRGEADLFRGGPCFPSQFVGR